MLEEVDSNASQGTNFPAKWAQADKQQLLPLSMPLRVFPAEGMANIRPGLKLRIKGMSQLKRSKLKHVFLPQIYRLEVDSPTSN